MSDEKPTPIVLLRHSTKSILRIEWPVDVSWLDSDIYLEQDDISAYKLPDPNTLPGYKEYMEFLKATK